MQSSALNCSAVEGCITQPVLSPPYTLAIHSHLILLASLPLHEKGKDLVEEGKRLAGWLALTPQSITLAAPPVPPESTVVDVWPAGVLVYWCAGVLGRSGAQAQNLYGGRGASRGGGQLEPSPLRSFLVS
ncbi:hypothetical protein E2C01_009086 [Portunus trituberculatus]|uniref:Uncharacterized protein n=1 Tax=Portunus trituberculatus TaxID=210409 RepID=A0A5B7D4I4_PORTR|nr:hypothetical protein [Portunus trituberculatus]